MTGRPDMQPEMILGVRVIELVLAHGLLLAICGGIGAVAGYAVSLGDERVYVTRGTIEVGVRYPKEPLENSLVAKERLAGHFAEVARKKNVEIEIDAQARRDPTSRALMRYIDFAVSAKTASIAEHVTGRGLENFLAEHAKLYEYERGLVEKERAYYERWATLLEASVTGAGTKGTDDADLGSAMFETERLRNISAGMLSELRVPPTRVITRPSPPGLTPSRAKPLAFGGMMIGLFAGAAIAILRTIKRKL